MLILFDYLTPLDNKRIENYIRTYGVMDEMYCGNAEYLKYWAKCKPHLFHLLGGKLIYKFPVSIKADEELLKADFEKLVYDYGDFLKNFNAHLARYYKTLETSSICDMMRIYESNSFIKNEIQKTIKIKLPTKEKILQLQAKMKPIRAMQKMIEYFDFSDLRKEFEEFRIQHSMILNDKKIEGNMCISIHPLDFLTLSDNNSNWSSCLSWKKNGCYKLGTVEMMNSNNVVCCYIENDEDRYCFGEDENDESYYWNNKQWRSLFIVTNDIIVGGKAYPYINEDLSKIVLNKLKELSETNLNKTYTFGPELYQDMKHIGSNFRMIKNREWIHKKQTTKHNIIFDTFGMYNDMFNVRNINYWCYRNKVKHNIIVSYSGYSPCACCGKDALEEGDTEANYEGSYNERYFDTGAILCKSCRRKITCDICLNPFYTAPLKSINGSNLCPNCYNSFVYKCPECNEPFVLTYKNTEPLYAKVKNKNIYQEDFLPSVIHNSSINPVVEICMCSNCKDKKKSEIEMIRPERKSNLNWISREYPVFKKIIDKDSPVWSKFLRNNLIPVYGE